MAAAVNPYFTLTALVLLAVCVVILNGVGLVIKLKRKPRSVNQFPYFWILIANLLIGVFCFPLYGLSEYPFHSTTIESAVCSARRFTYFTLTCVATFSILLMTIIRIFTFIPGLKPLKKTTIMLMYSICWIVLAIFYILPFVYHNHEHEAIHDCLYHVKKEWALVMDWGLIIAPDIVSVLCYLYLCRFLFINARKMQQYKPNTDAKTTKRSTIFEMKVTKEMMMVIGVFILCKIPSTVYYMVRWKCPTCIGANDGLLKFFLHLLVLLTALLTPMIFFWKNSDFRRKAIGLFKRSGRRKEGREIVESTSHNQQLSSDTNV